MIPINIDTIGKNIKFYRSLKGLTQCELAEGICTQAQISNIEAGKFIPLSTTLFAISKRLEVDMNQFFHAFENPQYDYVQEFIQEVRRQTENRNYKEVFQLVTAEEKNKLFKSSSLQQFILWHKGVAIAYLYKDYTLAIKMLFKAINLTYNGKRNYTQEEIQILNSIAAIYDLKGHSTQATEYYERSLKHANFIQDFNPKIKVRILYNYAKAETTLANYSKAINLAEQGRQICIENGLLYLFEECTYQKGFCYLLQGEVEMGKRLIEQAVVLFRLEKKEELATFAIKEVEEALTTIQ
ncbi:helix-turn-helix domain-containing protein [Alkalihalobacillus trypoxylicola]|uniref:HTH cro/C1-type domain-containing protein n=1 Tax=Alkalihalobacillus trypoxylicola TaxID=519424 RepID=A0A162F329_9BACI|nr:helix-turn-helix domain-containing protein [Alkalihalobacillus trypoxylicola]KYG34383.1 hypothetical protein AZF04_14425 [Alkalihalobacillus trypoxylicola]